MLTTRNAKPVLVIEDHEDTRDMVEMFLHQDGYKVCTAAHGMEGLECIARESPCLILLDVSMPIMDGPTFARRLRELPDREVAATPIVLITALSDPAAAVDATGAVDLISKPISFARVLHAVERHCCKDRH